MPHGDPILEEEIPNSILQLLGARIFILKFGRDCMGRQCARKLIDRGGPFTWSPRYPDHTPEVPKVDRHLPVGRGQLFGRSRIFLAPINI
jgi:hypothetical protein